MDKVIELAQERFAELSQILTRANEVREEWLELKAFLENAEQVQQRLDPSGAVPRFLPAQTVDMPPALRPVVIKRMEKSTELADYVLRNHGPQLHVTEVLERMSANGWIGSGDARKDYKNIHQLLASKPKRFRSLGKGMFERLGKAELGKPKKRNLGKKDTCLTGRPPKLA